MNKKRRQPLNDALAREFVYGEAQITKAVVEEKKKEETVSEEEEDREIELFSTVEQPNLQNMEKELVEKISNSSIENPKSKIQNLKSKESIMDKLKFEPKEATKRFTVDLSESMHRKLSILAAKTGRSKADIVRMLLDDALNDFEG